MFYITRKIAREEECYVVSLTSSRPRESHPCHSHSKQISQSQKQLTFNMSDSERNGLFKRKASNTEERLGKKYRRLADQLDDRFHRLADEIDDFLEDFTNISNARFNRIDSRINAITKKVNEMSEPKPTVSIVKSSDDEENSTDDEIKILKERLKSIEDRLNFFAKKALEGITFKSPDQPIASSIGLSGDEVRRIDSNDAVIANILCQRLKRMENQSDNLTEKVDIQNEPNELSEDKEEKEETEDSNDDKVSILQKPSNQKESQPDDYSEEVDEERTSISHDQSTESVVNDLGEDKCSEKGEKDWSDEVIDISKGISNRKKDHLDTHIVLAKNEEQSSDMSSLDQSKVSGKRNTKDEEWMKNFEQLRHYKMMHGDCDVPKNWKENPKLHNWVQRQRYGWNALVNGRSYKISPERAIKLHTISFNWSDKVLPPLSWDEQFDKIQRFQQEKGHCNVPMDNTEPIPLATWSAFNRDEYKKSREGNGSLVTQEQFVKLNAIGFDWEGAPL